MAPIKRIGAHSHVCGLGLDNDGTAVFHNRGLVGQISAREALGVVGTMVRNQNLAGRVILLAGPSGTGKTALAIGLHAELGRDIPFVHFNGSEVYSSEVKKTEILTTAFRKGIGLRLRESKEVYEGEVVDIAPEETENPHGGLSRTLAAVIITLRTAKGTKSLRLAPSIHDSLTREKVQPGDVIYIEAGTGVVSRVGRSERYASAYDLEMDSFVPVPKGEVLKKKDIVQKATLHDLDMANVKPVGGRDMASLVSQYTQRGKTELTDKLRNEVNRVVSKYVDEGIAEIVPGVVFIDECHVLDLECFSYLNRALESQIAPIVIFATNRGRTEVRDSTGNVLMAPHGIPPDFLERLMIIQTKPYTIDEVVQVIMVRMQSEEVELGEECYKFLADIAMQTSLRYVLSLIQPARVMASLEDRAIELTDLQEAEELFYDAQTSCMYLKTDAAKEYITS